MHTAIIATTLLGLSSLVYSTAIPKSHTNTNHSTVNYCSAPGICAPTEVHNQDCHTFDSPKSILQIDGSLTCTLYANPDCTKQFGSSQGKVKKVQGVFDTGSDERAAKKALQGGMGIFFC